MQGGWCSSSRLTPAANAGLDSQDTDSYHTPCWLCSCLLPQPAWQPPHPAAPLFVVLSVCRYFCVASKQLLPVPVPGLQQPCLCTPALLLQLQQQGAGQERIKAAAQQHGVSVHTSTPRPVVVLLFALSTRLDPPAAHTRCCVCLFSCAGSTCGAGAHTGRVSVPAPSTAT
jgi:hypothetical protein